MKIICVHLNVERNIFFMVIYTVFICVTLTFVETLFILYSMVFLLYNSSAVVLLG